MELNNMEVLPDYSFEYIPLVCVQYLCTFVRLKLMTVYSVLVVMFMLELTTRDNCFAAVEV